MFLIIASAAALSATAPVHNAEISHAANAYQASYETVSTVRFQQVEPRFASRPTTPVCRWQAELVVNRGVMAQGRPIAAIAKPIHRFAPIAGTHAGSCDAARSQVSAEIARYSEARSAEALTVAQQDRAALLSELDGIHSLSVKGG
jgi:hypothetical protein